MQPLLAKGGVLEFDMGSRPSTWGTGQGGTDPYGQQPGYGQGGPGQVPGTHAPSDSGPMTIDSVVQKTAISLGVVILAALATWILTGSLENFRINVERDFDVVGFKERRRNQAA